MRQQIHNLHNPKQELMVQEVAAEAAVEDEGGAGAEDEETRFKMVDAREGRRETARIRHPARAPPYSP